jgi:rhodanese-related sulfurtransferase
MGNSQSSTTNKINFEDIQYILNKGDSEYILINTLSETEQGCLIPKTTPAANETELLNKLLKNGNKDTKIVVYGRNCNDNKLYTKYNQLTTLGFYNVYIYTGGLFEWLMLQDIYGANEFPTTKKELDIIKYKPTKVLNIHLLKY